MSTSDHEHKRRKKRSKLKDLQYGQYGTTHPPRWNTVYETLILRPLNQTKPNNIKMMIVRNCRVVDQDKALTRQISLAIVLKKSKQHARWEDAACAWEDAACAWEDAACAWDNLFGSVCGYDGTRGVCGYDGTRGDTSDHRA